ncbi:MAG: hypothetical protein JRJ47_07040 [Deltaproteobacteria bacterium]|nr:hypothetical protein [Deltaproteobacteria bacterium]
MRQSKAPPKDEKYKLTGFLSKELFRRMKMHCVFNDMTIREFLESAISSCLPE